MSRITASAEEVLEFDRGVFWMYRFLLNYVMLWRLYCSIFFSRLVNFSAERTVRGGWAKA